MLPFALGSLVGYVSLAITGLVFFFHESKPWWYEGADPDTLEVVCVGALLPWAATCLAAELTAHFRRTRAFHSAVSQPWSNGVWGLAAAALGVSLGMPLAALAPDWLPDAAWTCATGMVAGAAVTLCMRRTPRGTCAVCGYALENAPRTTRCPECGQLTADVLVR